MALPKSHYPNVNQVNVKSLVALNKIMHGFYSKAKYCCSTTSFKKFLTSSNCPQTIGAAKFYSRHLFTQPVVLKVNVTSGETPLSVWSLSHLFSLSRLPVASLWAHHHTVSMATAARAERAVLCESKHKRVHVRVWPDTCRAQRH